MDKRKASILATISEAGALTPQLQQAIENCVVASELEDLYLPFRPKRKTRASAAAALGLGPLADRMWNVETADPSRDALKYLGDKVSSVEDALSGARDIIAEKLSETASIRENLRDIFRRRQLQVLPLQQSKRRGCCLVRLPEAWRSSLF